MLGNPKKDSSPVKAPTAPRLWFKEHEKGIIALYFTDLLGNCTAEPGQVEKKAGEVFSQGMVPFSKYKNNDFILVKKSELESLRSKKGVKKEAKREKARQKMQRQISKREEERKAKAIEIVEEIKQLAEKKVEGCVGASEEDKERVRQSHIKYLSELYKHPERWEKDGYSGRNIWPPKKYQ